MVKHPHREVLGDKRWTPALLLDAFALADGAVPPAADLRGGRGLSGGGFDALVLAMGIALLLPYLGAQDLWAPDEPRYAQVAEELRSFEHGPSGLVVMHLNGEAYTQKPPLYYWLAAGLGAALGGVNETAARLPSALAGIATAFLAWRFGSRLFGNTAGIWGAAVLLSVFRFAHTARRVQLDVVLTFLTMLALSAFWQLDRNLGPRTRNLVLLHGALGLAVLTKGPVGLLPIAVIVAYLAWERRLREIWRLLPPAALLLSLGPGLIWISAAVALSPPGFFGDAVTENLLGRFFAGTAHGRSPLYYLYQFPADFAPWSLFWPWVGVCAWRALTRAETGSNGPNGPSTGSASAWESGRCCDEQDTQRRLADRRGRRGRPRPAVRRSRRR